MVRAPAVSMHLRRPTCKGNFHAGWAKCAMSPAWHPFPSSALIMPDGLKAFSWIQPGKVHAASDSPTSAGGHGSIPPGGLHDVRPVAPGRHSGLPTEWTATHLCRTLYQRYSRTRLERIRLHRRLLYLVALAWRHRSEQLRIHERRPGLEGAPLPNGRGRHPLSFLPL